METIALTAVLIIRVFTGVIGLPMNPAPGLQITVVRTPAEYAAFVDRIPRKVLQPKQPAPASNDPLLKRPPVDFTRHMLVVVTSDATSVPVVIDKVERGGDDLFVTARCPNASQRDMVARPLGYGCYRAVEVDRVKGNVHLKNTKE